MSKQAALYIAVFATTALFIGRFFAIYKGNAAELATRRKQIPLLRRGRDSAFGAVVLLSVLLAAVLYVIAIRHR